MVPALVDHPEVPARALIPLLSPPVLPASQLLLHPTTQGLPVIPPTSCESTEHKVPVLSRTGVSWVACLGYIHHSPART